MGDGMNSPVVELPIIQNWSCHSCAGCCRQHAIVITEEERDRIVEQQWTTADGTPEGDGLFQRTGRWPWKRGWRLAHQADGACVFLNETGLCRIHAKFGEAAKPLACRIYPYAFHPKGDRVTVSLRFSCPSVVDNAGRAVVLQRSELLEIAEKVVPRNASRFPPPPLGNGCRLDWPESLMVIEAIDRCLSPRFGRDRSAPSESDDSCDAQGVTGDSPPSMRSPMESASVVIRLLRILHWLELLERTRLNHVRGGQLQELVQLLALSTVDEIPDGYDLALAQPPSRLGKLLFRLLAGQYARADRETAGGGLMDRARLFGAAVRLTWGGGNLPQHLLPGSKVRFDEIELPGFGLPEDADEILTRYLQVKVRGMHFCGRGFYNIPIIEGFRSLALLVAAVLWQARWRAKSAGRSTLERADIAQSLAVADHQHGYASLFGSYGFRGRVRTLSRLDDISRLIAWLSR